MQNNRLKYGLIAGTGTVLYLLAFYGVSPRLMLSSWVMWGSLVIYLACMTLACRRERSATTGGYPFQSALKTAFTVFVIANVIYYVFYYVLFNVIDPGLADLQRELVLENMDRYAGMLGEENAEELMRRYEEEDFRVTLSNTALGFAQSLIGGFILALIVAGVMKRG